MPAPPYSAGTEAPSRPSCAICGRMLAVEPVLAIQIVDLRRDFARAPLAHRLLEQPLFFGQIEINHEAVLREWMKGSILAAISRDRAIHAWSTIDRSPRPTASRSAALADGAASSRWSVLPNSAPTPSAGSSA